MISAVEPQVAVTDRRVDKAAMMLLWHARMGVGTEMSARRAHALDRYRPPMLQAADEADLDPQQVGLPGR